MKLEYSEENFNMLIERILYLRKEIDKYKYDPLTKLRQRSDFDDELDRAFERYEFDGIPFVFIFADAVGLHEINRSDLGYEGGNSFLVEISKKLKEHFGNISDNNIFRISGDEFGIIVNRCCESCIKKIKNLEKTCDTITFAYTHVNRGSNFSTPSSVFKNTDKEMIRKKSLNPKSRK